MGRGLRKIAFNWSMYGEDLAGTRGLRQKDGKRLVRNNAICNLKDVPGGSASRTSRTVAHTSYEAMIYSSRGTETFKVAHRSSNISVKRCSGRGGGKTENEPSRLARVSPIYRGNVDIGTRLGQICPSRPVSILSPLNRTSHARGEKSGRECKRRGV